MVIKALDPDPDEMNADPQLWLEADVCCCDPNHGCDYQCGAVVTPTMAVIYDCGAVVRAAVAVVTRHVMGGVVGAVVTVVMSWCCSDAVMATIVIWRW